MTILKTLFKELISLFQLGPLLEMYYSGNYSLLLEARGIISVLSPILPILLIVEIIRAILYKKFRIEDYKMPFAIRVVNHFIARFISLTAVGFCIGLFEQFAIIKTTFTWYWFIYGYIIWEFAHYVYHYLGHKVRIFWCLHSIHHTPQNMNLSVAYTNFFLEGPYADVIRTSICILLGVNPVLLLFIMALDGIWSGFTHVGENILKDGRLGFLNSIILTPAHHRIHHARNPVYIDTNFCNMLNIWDRAFKTYQKEEPGTKIEYGITRPLNSRNFMDVYFGEFYYLWMDIKKAPGVLNKVLYVFMPPGWNHNGEHKTASRIKLELKSIGNMSSKDPSLTQTESKESILQ